MNNELLKLSVSEKRLISRLKQLGITGKNSNGVLTRLAMSESDKLGRDLFVSWLNEVGLEVKVDRIGNIFGVWTTPKNKHMKPIMMGSHIDTVINGGIYDGCYGVISGLEVIQTMIEHNYDSPRPIVVAAFSNEEGVRYQPDMMGSLVYANGLPLESALNTVGTDGTKLYEELERIGYAGQEEPGFIMPFAYIELHVEQGPILDYENVPIGVVENLQGISWQEISIEGVANHAGTTPMSMRCDAGVVAAKIITFLNERANISDTKTVSTVGSIDFSPNLVNVIPSSVKLTVDLRNPNDSKLIEEEKVLCEYLLDLERTDEVKIVSRQLVRFNPVQFDIKILDVIENSATVRKLKSKRMTSGAGHDAQMISKICPTAMIFVPSKKGISHNPDEYTDMFELVSGANVLLDSVLELSK